MTETKCNSAKKESSFSHWDFFWRMTGPLWFVALIIFINVLPELDRGARAAIDTWLGRPPRPEQFVEQGLFSWCLLVAAFLGWWRSSALQEEISELRAKVEDLEKSK